MRLYKSVLLFALATTFLAADAPAQSGVPKFTDYAVAETYNGRTAPLVLTRASRMYRTRLREASTGRPNFAGRYIVTTWGCGTACLMGAVIDARTGKVFMLPHTLCCWTDVGEDFKPVDFKLNSRLLIFNAARDEKDNDYGAHYYKFTAGRFTLIRSILKPS